MFELEKRLLERKKSSPASAFPLLISWCLQSSLKPHRKGRARQDILGQNGMKKFKQQTYAG